MLRGFGFALFQEPDGYLDNRVTLVFQPSGELALTLTGQTGGQGHETTFAQVASDRLGVPFDSVQVLQGDSDVVGPGSGSGGSRTATVASMGVTLAAEAIVERGKHIAAELMEASAEDVTFAAGGTFAIAGTDRIVSLREVVAASFEGASRFPDSNEIGLQATSHYRAKQYNYPCGCHVCEVEIDPRTGALALVRYTAVNDHGVVINPMLLEGQVHGGVAQGPGAGAPGTHTVYDPDTGQLVSGSFMDYAIPRADDIPMIEFKPNCVPARTNPLGVKGVGESGCTAACPAVMNAIVDALAPLGITHTSTCPPRPNASGSRASGREAGSERAPGNGGRHARDGCAGGRTARPSVAADGHPHRPHDLRTASPARLSVGQRGDARQSLPRIQVRRGRLSQPRANPRNASNACARCCARSPSTRAPIVFRATSRRASSSSPRSSRGRRRAVRAAARRWSSGPRAQRRSRCWGHPTPGSPPSSPGSPARTPRPVPYPFTTRFPQPAMLPYEDIHFQLVDLPPIARDHPVPWIVNALQPAGAALLVVDLSDPACIERTAEIRTLLAEKRVSLLADWDAALEPLRTSTPATTIRSRSACRR